MSKKNLSSSQVDFIQRNEFELSFLVNLVKIFFVFFLVALIVFVAGLITAFVAALGGYDVKFIKENCVLNTSSGGIFYSICSTVSEYEF